MAICDCKAKFHYVILACGYAIHMIRLSRNLAEMKFGGAVGDRQTAKLNSPPNFPAIRYEERKGDTSDCNGLLSKKYMPRQDEWNTS